MKVFAKPRSGDDRVGGGRVDHRNAGLFVHLRGRNRRARIEVAHDYRDARVDQLLRGLHADARVGLVVFGDELELRDLVADLDLLRVGFLDGEPDAVLQILAVAGVGAGQRRGEADLHRQVVGETGQRRDREDSANEQCKRFQRVAKTHGLSFHRQCSGERQGVTLDRRASWGATCGAARSRSDVATVRRDLLAR